MVGSAIERMIENLERAGFVDVVLPFLLIFAIIFALLEKVKVLGDNKKNLNVVVAFVVGLLVVIPHVTNRYPPGADPVQILNDALPQVSLVVVAIVFLLIMIGVLGGGPAFLGMKLGKWIFWVSLLIIILIFGGASGWWEGRLSDWLTNTFGPDSIAIAVMLLVAGIIWIFLTDEGDRQRPWSDVWPREPAGPAAPPPGQQRGPGGPQQ